MPNTTPILSYILLATNQFKYPLVFIGVIIEGPLLMIVSGFLLKLGFFSLAPLFIALVAGDLLADIIWYYIGRFLLGPFLQKHGHFLSVTPELFEKAKQLFLRYHIKILFISKMTIGFGMAIVTLMTAGATKVPFRIYFILNLIGEIFLVAVLLLVGYFYGHIYTSIADEFRLIFIIAAILVSILLTFGFSRYVKNKIIKP